MSDTLVRPEAGTWLRCVIRICLLAIAHNKATIVACWDRCMIASVDTWVHPPARTHLGEVAYHTAGGVGVGVRGARELVVLYLHASTRGYSRCMDGGTT